MYNLIEYSDNYSKTSGILWQYCREEITLNFANDDTVYINAGNATSNLIKIKEKVTGKADSYDTKDVEIMAPYHWNILIFGELLQCL